MKEALGLPVYTAVTDITLAYSVLKEFSSEQTLLF